MTFAYQDVSLVNVDQLEIINRLKAAGLWRHGRYIFPSIQIHKTSKDFSVKQHYYSMSSKPTKQTQYWTDGHCYKHLKLNRRKVVW